ncbi:epimerase [Rhizobium sp. P40RR-XXII]|uniref:epimerase n=1 Tax=Rhizobium sp. P40RR-XXII TaxID=2726739 RepID=UPI0014576BDB|nr:epimerase [Rhizobium sp. P40RR-XXII]NLS20706.1 epimerase [Rhizobium sp. P40RR-XXII]
MKVTIFGATGLIGQGVLRECLGAGDVEQILSVSRTSTGEMNPRLRELLLSDLFTLAEYEDQLSGYDACFFSLGVSSVGMDEATYTRLTFDLTLSIATLLASLNPQMTFIYVSGVGTDASGRSMWARVKGRTENALAKLPFKTIHLFRPAGVLPVHGERSKVAHYNWLYDATGWFFRPLRGLMNGYVVTTEEIGTAMLNVARMGWKTTVLEPADIRKSALS